MDSPAPIKRTAFQGPCYLKVLVDNFVAGAIIGKSGTVIASIEQNTGCALKLSHSGAHYPGTDERILIMSGDQKALNDALSVVLQKIHDVQQPYSSGGEAANKESFGTVPPQPASSVRITVKIVVPKSAVSAIIGKGGQEIKKLQEDTSARVQVSSRDEALPERMVTITGTFNEARAAALAVAECIQNDPNLKTCMFVVYKQGSLVGTGVSVGYGPLMGYGPTAAYTAHGFHAAHHGPEIITQHCEISIQVPETAVGAVIGKGGRYVLEIMKHTGARIQISPKGEFVPGTNDRKIVISGTVGAVHHAHIVLLQKVHAAQEALGGPSNGMHSNGISHGVDVQQTQHDGTMLQGTMQYVHPTTFGY